MHVTDSRHERNRMNAFGMRTESTVEPMLLTTRQAARTLSVSERTLYSLREAGEIRAVRVSKRGVRYSIDDLREYVRRASEKK